ncbi:rhodanese-like domain-containing protein [Acinetobacter larvae]|uniref:Rhodanese n=1 Tax=Acinetobacter larvae TaxID=1789224 RepID=A0A1B2LZM5_9GAMM|nr:rhodanese-like domain-containing protein [Acinetobacter larvae]AOA58377.1 rhodanese [Acinetobacter larvae]
MNIQLNPTPTLPLDHGTNSTQQSTEDILAQAQHDAQASQLNFSGSLSPIDAWALVQRGDAVLIDVRTNEERKFVGYIEESIHVAWATGTAFNRNPRFLKELEHKVSKQQVVLLLCRSGKRSALAAEAAFKAGFEQVYNVLEGFEGELDAKQQRNQYNGWKARHLPWQQE